MNADDLTSALRNCAAGLLPLEACAELLISNGTFLHREDFTSRFIEHGISSGTPMAAIDWDAVTAALNSGDLPCSGANGASSSYRPASPKAPPSASATPSPASTTTTPSGSSPPSSTRPENDQDPTGIDDRHGMVTVSSRRAQQAKWRQLSMATGRYRHRQAVAR